MANLDTRSKRASSLQVLAAHVLAPILPDGAIGQADRQHIAWTYAGILAAGAAVTGPGSIEESDTSLAASSSDARRTASSSDSRAAGITVTEWPT